MFFEGISDTFTRKPSEVHCFSRVPPTLLQGNRRRSNVFRGYLRHFYKETVGGPVFFEGISDTFTRKPSEVQCFSRVSPTFLPGNCRRSCVLPDIQRLCSYIPDSFADVELNEISNDSRCRAAISSFPFRGAKNLVCHAAYFH